MLPPGVVAEVSGRQVSAELIEQASAAAGLATRVVAERAVKAELLAAYLAEARPDFLRVATRASLARALLTELRGEAFEQGGPVREAEAAAIIERRWTEYARPRAVRTLHTVALPKSEEHRDAARAVAERVAQAVLGIAEPKEFARIASEIAESGDLAGGVELRTEVLPPVTEDGRTVQERLLDRGGPPALVVEYAKAAQSLSAPGEQSPVTETSYGYHVLMALEIVPEVALTASDAYAAVADEALSLRVRPKRQELVARLRASTPVEVARNAAELTRWAVQEGP